MGFEPSSSSGCQKTSGSLLIQKNHYFCYRNSRYGNLNYDKNEVLQQGKRTDIIEQD